MAIKFGKIRKGQVFTIGAVLFASLIVIIFLTTGDLAPGTETGEVQGFFQNTFDKTPVELNQALKQNYTVPNARNRLYSYSRFIERRASSKGITFEAGYYIILPEKGESIFINYYDSSEDLKLQIDGKWTNETVGSGQYTKQSFTSGNTSVRVKLPGRSVDNNFTVSNPKIFYHMRMSSDDQIWINSRLS